MSFSTFSNQGGGLSVDAVLEQTTLVGCLSWNRRDLAQQLLDTVGGGTIRAWQFNENSWPPSWALIQQGNHLYVILSGSSSSVHWYGNIVGCFAVQYGSFANYVHNFFYSVWQSLRIELLLNMPPGFETMEISFVGHSFGSAVAFLGAADWQRSFQSPRVEYLGLAQPRTLTDGYTGALPAVRFHVSTDGDAVPNLPPNSMVLSVLDALSQYRYSVPMDWRHYAAGYRYQTDGTLREVAPAAFNTPPSSGQLATTPFRHPIAMYMQAAETAWQTQVRQGRGSAIVAISQQIRAMPSPQNANVNIDFRQYVDIQQQNQQIFRSQGPGPLTPENLNDVNNTSGIVLGRSSADGIFPALTGGNAEMRKMTFFFHVNNAGYSESHLVTPAQDNVDGLLRLATAYTNKRMDVSGVNTFVDWIRFSTVGTARRVVVFTPFDMPAGTSLKGTFNFGGHGGVEASDFGATSILLRKVALDGTFSHWFFRGVPDNVVADGGLYSNHQGYTSAMNRLGNFCKTSGFQWAGASKEPGLGFAISALVNNGVGQIVFTCTGNPFNGVAVGTRLRIRVAQQGMRPNLNGTWTVTVQDANTGVSTNTSWMPAAPVATGRVWKMNAGGGTIDSLSIERITERRVGRPFGLYRGRSKRRVAS